MQNFSKSIYVSILLFLILLCDYRGNHCLGENRDAEIKITSSDRREFFTSKYPDEFKFLKKYTIYPEDKKSLPAKENPGVLEEFYRCLSFFLRPKYMPSFEFCQKNIYLVPGSEFKKATKKEDSAFLRWEITNENKRESLLASQTGGGNAHIYISFYSERKDLQALPQTDLKKMILTAVGKYFAFPDTVITLNNVFDDFEFTNKEEILIFQRKQIPWNPKEFTREEQYEVIPYFGVKVFFTKGRFCYIFPKYDKTTHEVARPGSPDKWFELRDKQWKTRQEIEKLEKKRRKEDDIFQGKRLDKTKGKLAELCRNLHHREGKYQDASERSKLVSQIAEIGGKDAAYGLIVICGKEPEKKVRDAATKAAREILTDVIKKALEKTEEPLSDEQSVEEIKKLVKKLVNISSRKDKKKSDRQDFLSASFNLADLIPKAIPYAITLVQDSNIPSDVRRSIIIGLSETENIHIFDAFLRILSEDSDKANRKRALNGLEKLLKKVE